MAALPMPPVVFVGPSCPVEDILSALPDAVLAPPVQRGDLYRCRLLKFTHFVILDGVFANRPGVSPREVVDVLRDGAVVVGASSMGALRAADCAPAGAFGVGTVFRLFRRRVLSSEDEVAVAFWPDRPFPPVTEPLVNMRVALRRAVNAGRITRGDADRVLTAALALPYDRRTWGKAIEHAELQLAPEEVQFLKSVDAKRTDAIACSRWVARRLREGRLPARPREGEPNLFGLMGDGRERRADPLDGTRLEDILPEFVIWLACRGQQEPALELDAEAVANAVEAGRFETVAGALGAMAGAGTALLMQFTAFRRGLAHSERVPPVLTARDIERAEAIILDAHKVRTWAQLLERHQHRPRLCDRLTEYRTQIACLERLKNGRLFPRAGASQIPDLPPWKRD